MKVSLKHLLKMTHGNIMMDLWKIVFFLAFTNIIIKRMFTSLKEKKRMVVFIMEHFFKKLLYMMENSKNLVIMRVSMSIQMLSRPRSFIFRAR